MQTIQTHIVALDFSEKYNGATIKKRENAVREENSTTVPLEFSSLQMWMVSVTRKMDNNTHIQLLYQ